MEVTRDTVAKYAGVSKQTVSYYYNKTRYISPKTVEKIEKAIAELNYIPNLMARSLISKQSNVIGIVCNRLANPHYSELLASINKAATQNGYNIIISDAEYHPKEIIEQLIGRAVGGIILLTFPERVGIENIRKIESRNIPLIITHSAGVRIENHFQLEPDYIPAMMESLTWLRDNGHKKVAILSAYDESFKRDVRLSCFIAAHKAVFQSDAVVINRGNNSTSIEHGACLAGIMLKEHRDVTAVFTTNDLMCIGAMQVFKDNGLNVPRDISIIGTDDLEFGRFISPTLSTMSYDKYTYGHELFKMFLGARDGEEARLELVPVNFIKRESVAAIEKK